MRLTRWFSLILIFILCLPLLGLSQEPDQIVVPDRVNSAEQQAKPYLIMISLDGFRYDLADKYNAEFLKRKRAEGVQASSMQPSFPSMTFPNHYTLATGLYPAHHGIVSNNFIAGKNSDHVYSLGLKEAVQNAGFYAGVPLWVLAEKHKMLSASFYWVGSEAQIDSTFATYYYNYSEAIPIDRRVEIVKEWLTLPEEKRPHLIMFYMPEVDHAEHRYGMESDKVRDAVQLVDGAVRKLNEMTDQLNLPVNYIIVSDHGMMDIDTENVIRKPESLDTSKYRMGFGSTLIHLYAKDKHDVALTYKTLKKRASGYSVYLKKNTPKRWVYNTKNDYYNRLGDIILVADPGKAFSFNGRRTNAGNHGFDNKIPEMQATFYAWGPDFKENLKIPSFENINIYPMVARLLGLDLLCPVDGRLKVLENILKE